MNSQAVARAIALHSRDRAVECVRVVCNAGGCLRCALRFIPISTTGPYESSEEIIREALRDLDSTLPFESFSAVSTSSPCVCCLGMLQDSTMKSVAETCTERVKKFEHDGVIRLNLSAPPVCSIIRQRAMEIHVRKMVKPNSDEDPVTLRTGAKYSLGHAIETAIGASYDQHSDFFSNVHFCHEESMPEMEKLVNMQKQDLHRNKRRKTNVPFETFASWMDRDVSTVEKAVRALSDEGFKAQSDVPPKRCKDMVEFDVLCSVSDILLSGRYLKFSRRVSQSPWKVEDHGEEKTSKVDSSVEDIIVPKLKEQFLAEHATFIPGGREDVDVRMLGTGRPFVVRISGARKVPSRATEEVVAKLEVEINRDGGELVKVVELARTDKRHLEWMRSVESQKRKTYACVIRLNRPPSTGDLEKLNALTEMKIIQKTPVRVFHRYSSD
mmetsp:Transcript_41399/g.163065  ORF Transcript_41399/g.163065 Transcript_41399/m.163065 type:complete len:440 (-) Transcript_41399:401-1720(-)